MSAFTTQLAALKTAVEGIDGRQVLSPMPLGAIEDIELPIFGMDFDTFQVKASNVSIFHLPVNIMYFHERTPDNGRFTIPDAVIDMPQRIYNTVAGTMELWESGYGFDVPEESGIIGVAAWYDRTYIGCQLTIVLKDKENTTWR